MTREMNKPDWHNVYLQKKLRCKCFECKPYSKPECWQCSKADEKPKPRILNPDIAEFFYATNERLK